MGHKNIPEQLNIITWLYGIIVFYSFCIRRPKQTVHKSHSAGLSGVLNSKIFGSYRKYKYIYRYLVSFYFWILPFLKTDGHCSF